MHDGFTSSPLPYDGRGSADSQVGATPSASSLGQAVDFGRYALLARLGGGGMADVFLAASRPPAAHEAPWSVLKVLKPDLGREPRFVRMFLREAALAARLVHPHVVHTIGVERAGDRYGIVMEYLEGATLRQLLARLRHRGFADRRPLLAVIDDVLAGLAYVHDFGEAGGPGLHLVHRDVKPANVMVTFAGAAKVLDFGIAKAFAADVEDATGTLHFKGTLRYSAPEAVNRGRGEATPPGSGLRPAIDRRVDLYGVGCLLWEVLSGRLVWDGLGNLEIVRAMAEGRGPPLVPPADAPASLFALCRAAMDPDPTARPQSAGEFRAALRASLDADDIDGCRAELLTTMEAVCGEERACRAALVAQTLAAADAPPSADGASAGRRSPPRRARPVAMAAWGMGAGLVGVLATGTGWLGDPSEPSTLRGPSPKAWSAALPGEVSRPGLDLSLAALPIEVIVAPADAVLELDGVRLDPRAPRTLARPAAGSARELRVEAPGHEPVVLSLTGDTPPIVEIVLERRRRSPRHLDFDRRNPFAP